jgi:hypothetical protein
MPPQRRTLPWQRLASQGPSSYSSYSGPRRQRRKPARRRIPSPVQTPATCVSGPATYPVSNAHSNPRAASPKYFSSDDDDDVEFIDSFPTQPTPPSSSGAVPVANRPLAHSSPRLAHGANSVTPQSSSRTGAYMVPPGILPTPPATQGRSQPYQRVGTPSSSQETPQSSYRANQDVRPPSSQQLPSSINRVAPQINRASSQSMNRMSSQSAQSSQPSSQANPIMIDSDDEDISSTPFQPENDFISIGYVSKDPWSNSLTSRLQDCGCAILSRYRDDG